MPHVLVADDDLAMLCAGADVLARLGCEGPFDLIVPNELEAAVSKLIPSPPIAERPS